MKKYILIIALALAPSLLMAQAAGGTIKRPNQYKNSSKSSRDTKNDSSSKNSSNAFTFKANGVTFKMVLVDGGSFIMGGTTEQGDDAEKKEKPAHRVDLSSFYIGETEVTQALWEAVMADNPSTMKGYNLPVESVNWHDCNKFIDNLNKITGAKFRLPTEAEWEFAARGGNKSKKYKYSGSDDINNVAWHDGNSKGKTHPVKTKQPNELGLYDMSGNVDEWCLDWYGDYESEPQTDPTGPQTGSFRVLRGGSFFFGKGSSRISSRSNNVPGYYDFYPGLRLALNKPQRGSIK